MANTWRFKPTGEKGELVGSVRGKKPGDVWAAFKMESDDEGEHTLVDPIHLVLKDSDWEKLEEE